MEGCRARIQTQQKRDRPPLTHPISVTYKLGPRHKSREVSSRTPNWGWLLIPRDSHHALGTLPLNWTFFSPSALGPAQPSRLRQRMKRLVPITWSDNLSVKDSPESERPEGIFLSEMSHTCTHACADLGEGAPWKEAPGVLSSTPPLKPQSFPHFPQCCFSPSPLHLGERKLHNPLGAAKVARDYSQHRGKLQPEASSPPQAGWFQPPQPQPRVSVLDRAFLSHQFHFRAP